MLVPLAPKPVRTLRGNGLPARKVSPPETRPMSTLMTSTTAVWSGMKGRRPVISPGPMRNLRRSHRIPPEKSSGGDAHHT